MNAWRSRTFETFTCITVVIVVSLLQILSIWKAAVVYAEPLMSYSQDVQLKVSPKLPLLGAFFHVQTPGQIKRAFLKHKIVPDIIEKAPKDVLRVNYKNRASVAKYGNVLKPTEIERKPCFVRWPATKDSVYTLLMIDPDAAVTAPNTSYLHWYVVNIRNGKIKTGLEVAKYISPRPKKGTGLHRLIFLLYTQPLGELIFYDEMNYNDTRTNFSIGKIVEEHQLGQPAAGNFFQSQWVRPRPTKKPIFSMTTAKNCNFVKGKII
ncbi:protein D1 [Bemisia tabaci]|uniref:protein D1 n=1 Tax=Bemisia tabaci TaxID=7038 RepID=UPI003B281B97